MGAAEICTSDPDPNMAPIWNSRPRMMNPAVAKALFNGNSPAKMFGHFGIVILHLPSFARHHLRRDVGEPARSQPSPKHRWFAGEFRAVCKKS